MNRFLLPLLILIIASSGNRLSERVIRNTESCQGWEKELVWQIDEDSTITQKYLTQEVGDTLICKTVDNREECWSVRVYPRPSNLLRITVIDTTSEGDINLVVCFWLEEGESEEELCYPICQLTRLANNSTMSLCTKTDSTIYKGLESYPAEFCTTLVNDVKPK